MKQYESALHNLKGGYLAAKVQAEKEDHTAWVAVMKFPESYFGTDLYNYVWRTATHVVYWIEVHNEIVERYNQGHQELDFGLCRTVHKWSVDSEKEACEILGRYLTDDTPLRHDTIVGYPRPS